MITNSDNVLVSDSDGLPVEGVANVLEEVA
jgi:hypothetical protein